MTLLDYIEIVMQFCVLMAMVCFIVILILRQTNWRFPRRVMYWPWYLLNDLADRPPDRLERIFEKLQSIRVRW